MYLVTSSRCSGAAIESRATRVARLSPSDWRPGCDAPPAPPHAGRTRSRCRHAPAAPTLAHPPLQLLLLPPRSTTAPPTTTQLQFTDQASKRCTPREYRCIWREVSGEGQPRGVSTHGAARGADPARCVTHLSRNFLACSRSPPSAETYQPVVRQPSPAPRVGASVVLTV